MAVLDQQFFFFFLKGKLKLSLMKSTLQQQTQYICEHNKQPPQGYTSNMVNNFI
jgi:hypothetical protein